LPSSSFFPFFPPFPQVFITPSLSSFSLSRSHPTIFPFVDAEGKEVEETYTTNDSYRSFSFFFLEELPPVPVFPLLFPLSVPLSSMTPRLLRRDRKMSFVTVFLFFLLSNHFSSCLLSFPPSLLPYRIYREEGEKKLGERLSFFPPYLRTTSFSFPPGWAQRNEEKRRRFLFPPSTCISYFFPFSELLEKIDGEGVKGVEDSASASPPFFLSL